MEPRPLETWQALDTALDELLKIGDELMMALDGSKDSIARAKSLAHGQARHENCKQAGRKAAANAARKKEVNNV